MVSISVEVGTGKQRMWRKSKKKGDMMIGLTMQKTKLDKEQKLPEILQFGNIYF